MATFDPRVQAHISGGGSPSMGSAPQLIGLTGTAALGHLVSSMEIKKDANAHNRGVFNADEHIGSSVSQLQSFKAQHITDVNFDDQYRSFIDETLEKARSKAKYHTENEKEYLAYNERISSFKKMEITRSFGEAMTAFHNNQIGMVNKNFDEMENLYAESSDPSMARLAASELFRSAHEASLPHQKYPGIITAEQGALKFNETMRRSELTRISRTFSARELFELGHAQRAHISVFETNPDLLKRGVFFGDTTSVPLSQKERDTLIAFALHRQKNALELEQNARKFSEEITHAQKTVMDRQFYDGVSTSQGVKGPELLNSLRLATREDGVPLFSGEELKTREDYIQTVRKEVAHEAAEPIESNMAEMSRLHARIIDPSPNKMMPSVDDIMLNRQLRIEHRLQLVNSRATELQRERTHDRTEFEHRRSQGIQLLKAQLGGDAFIEMTDTTKNFYGELLNAYIARINQRYDDANAVGNGLKAIDPQAIVNQLIEERAVHMNRIFFPDIERQVKALSLYVNRVPKDLPENTPVSAVLDQIVKDMQEPGTTPHRRGTLPVNEGIRLIQLLRAAQSQYRTIGELRKVMETDLGTSREVSDPAKPVMPKGGLLDTIKSFFEKEKR